MVDTEPVPAADLEFLHGVLRRHEEETGSVVAAEVLAEWPASVARFTRVMPRDYRRVLEIQAQASARGEDPIAAVMGAIGG